LGYLHKITTTTQVLITLHGWICSYRALDVSYRIISTEPSRCGCISIIQTTVLLFGKISNIYKKILVSDFPLQTEGKGADALRYLSASVSASLLGLYEVFGKCRKQQLLEGTEVSQQSYPKDK